uniref:Granulin a n=1 Tax=Cyclopterus lumpus TaxID=8103 RepID=A0A8C2W811_CYCLU
MIRLWVVIYSALLALVGADECPDGGRCEYGQTCCNDPASGYECCPLDQAECCEDHVHCCPAGTVCNAATSSCLNSTGSVAWAERASADRPGLSKSFRMIKAYLGEEDDNVCPDRSRCPAEFSCLRALTKYGCCPLAQGVPCSDGKHCCPEGHQCSADSRSCIKKELVSTILCSDGVSECPDESTCCETPVGTWACCPMLKAVCCEDKSHCCPEGTACDVEHNKCISSSNKRETPMWAKFPARMRADWENQIVPPAEKDDSSVTQAAAGEMFTLDLSTNVPCDGTAVCADNTTCCKNAAGGWSCCPLPEAVCCVDLVHCCPKGKRCNLVVQTCDDDRYSVPWVKKVPAIPRQDAQVGNVTCDSTHFCPDGSTCCRTLTKDWACCGLPQVNTQRISHWIDLRDAQLLLTSTITNKHISQNIEQYFWHSLILSSHIQQCFVAESVLVASFSKKTVCCDDHEHCCPTGTTCDLATITCGGPSGSTPMVRKMPAFSTAERIQCDPHTSCPQSTTCCYMNSSHKWGCCPLPQAVCCSDGDHCCPVNYHCSVRKTTCIKGEVVIPWYTKLPARTGVQADPSSVKCGGESQCPEQTTCCRLLSGEWGCCPITNAVCCPDKEHCCPHGYTCNMASNSCQKLILLQLEAVALTRVYLPERQPALGPSMLRDIHCDELIICPDGNTCCRTSASSWGCCPTPNAVCCSDMQHCCPAGYTCSETGGCTQNTGLHWHKWHVFFTNKKRALIV